MWTQAIRSRILATFWFCCIGIYVKKLARFLLMMAGLAALPACASSDGMVQRSLAPAPAPQTEQRVTVPEPVITASTKHTVSVYFDTASDEIRAGAMQRLYGAAVELNEKGSRIIAIRIIGHTDASGKRSFNQRLSERRAAAVADQLVKLGLRAEMVVIRGIGEASAQGKRNSREHRRADIEFETVVEQAASLTPQAESITAQVPVVESAVIPANRGTTALPGPFSAVAAVTTEALSPPALQRGDKHAIKLTFLRVGTTWLPPPMA